MIIDRDHRDAIVYGLATPSRCATQMSNGKRSSRRSTRIGTDVALVSINQPGVLGLRRMTAIAIARDANDELLALAGSSGGRITGLARWRWQRPGRRSEELERVVALGMRGAMVLSNMCGDPVDAPLFEPILEAASTFVPLCSFTRRFPSPPAT